MSDFWRHVRLAFTRRGPYDPTGRDQEIARLRVQELELRDVLRNLRDCVTTQTRDMAQQPMEAWLYGALAGWECEVECQEDWDPEHTCDGAMREVAERHDWSESDVVELRRFRRAIKAASGDAS